MVANLKLTCDPRVVLIAIDKILPMKATSSVTRQSRKYQCIAASVRELGVIEPLVVFRQTNGSEKFMMLDGHLRLDVLKQMGETEAPCLLSHDDEAFTYNHKVSRLTAIQEHFMILRAIKNGASEARIATSLNVDLECIRKKTELLNGICPEAVTLLKDKRASAGAIRELRRAKPMRQIEIAELMSASNNFAVDYAKCLIAATPDDQLVEPDRPKDIKGLTPDDIARMEREMETLGREFRLIEESHGQNTLNLVVVVGYLRKLLDNARVVRYLSQSFPELLAEFQKLVESRSLRE